MGCGSSNARIAVEPNLNTNEDVVPVVPISPVQIKQRQIQTNPNNNRYPINNTNGTEGAAISNTTSTNTSKPATKGMPWANKDNKENETRKKKKKTNKIIVTNKATKNKTTKTTTRNNASNNIQNNNNKNNKIKNNSMTTSEFTPLESTATYNTIDNDVATELPITTSIVPPVLSTKPKVKPVKVKRRKRPRPEGTTATTTTTSSTTTSTEMATETTAPATEEIKIPIEPEASITSLSSIISPDLSPASPVSLDDPLDSPEPTPKPPPPKPFIDPARQSDPRPCPSIEKIGPATLGVQTSMTDARFNTGIEGLTQRWGEVEFLLRIPIKNDNDIDVFSRTAYQSILLLQEIEKIARDLGILQGALSRWLMPYDSNTSIADQSHINVVNPNDSNGNVIAVNPIFASITIEKRREMTHQLMDLRKLVRVKIADDGDLAQALKMVVDMDAFFRLLVEESSIKTEIHGVMLPYNLLQTHLHF